MTLYPGIQIRGPLASTLLMLIASVNWRLLPLAQAAGSGAQLIIAPETCLDGYALHTLPISEARALAEHAETGPSIRRLREPWAVLSFLRSGSIQLQALQLHLTGQIGHRHWVDLAPGDENNNAASRVRLRHLTAELAIHLVRHSNANTGWGRAPAATHNHVHVCPVDPTLAWCTYMHCAHCPHPTTMPCR